MKAIRLDLKTCNLFKDLAKDKSEWRDKVYVAYPNIVGTRPLLLPSPTLHMGLSRLNYGQKCPHTFRPT